MVVVIFPTFLFAQQKQSIAQIKITLDESTLGLQIPVSVCLDEITFLADSLLSLNEVEGNNKKSIPFQINRDEHRTLTWFVSGDKGEVLIFDLLKEIPDRKNKMTISDDGTSLTISSSNNNLLSYHHAVKHPPEGVDPAYKRSGFIHPLYTPHGQVLTRIQPPDHYHHYGIWNPWTHVLFDGDTIDFWNLAKKKGTVEFDGFTSKISGSVFSEYSALHNHVVFKDKREITAMNEIQTVRVYNNQSEPDHFIVDMTMKMNCATDKPFTILEYRYAGFGWRTTEKWDKNNSEVISSQGKDRVHTDGSKERWAIVQGALDEDYGGVVMMSYPTNYNHPEPMRIWPLNMYDRGDMFASFTTTKDMDWQLEPYHEYTLKYRLLVYNGKMTKERAEIAWHYFANPPKVNIQLSE